MGVYYKFNEGITGTSSVDSSVLDYSGRISNGVWTGYTSGSRFTGSAMVLAAAAESEYKDPIIYSFHSDVENEINILTTSGSVWDEENGSMIYHYFPNFMLEEEEGNGELHLKNLTQIMASYLDELQIYIKSLPDIMGGSYATGSSVLPTSMYQKMIASRGMSASPAPEIFEEATIREHYASRDGLRNFELDLDKTRGLIYQNVYNNLVSMYKSKGTEKSFRNLIRCYGVDEELVKLGL